MILRMARVRRPPQPSAEVRRSRRCNAESVIGLSSNGEKGKKSTPMAKAKGKVTSKAVARKASAALRDGRSSSRTKSIAASALAQTPSKPKK